MNWNLVSLVLVLCVVSRATTTDTGYDALDDRIAQLETTLDQLRSTFQSLEAKPTAYEEYSLGVSYIHWGRTTCNGDATLIYTGHAAGSHYAEGGGGTNRLCLHDELQKNAVFPGFGPEPSHVFGVEYQISSENYVFSMNNSDGHQLTNYPTPCAACQARNRTSVLMVPARVSCPYGWTEEYKGYVVAEVSSVETRRRSEYICWDEAPEKTTGAAAQDQALIYVVEVASGSLPASIFVDGIELACVVCTK